MFTSKSMRGFYDPEFNDVMPEDAVEITVQAYAELMNGQSSGKIIDWSKENSPVLADVPLPTVEELDAAATANREAAYRAEADPLFYQWQRDEIDKQVWLDKVSEIKLRFPQVQSA